MTVGRSSSQPLVSIGLVTWNSAAYLEACLQGIRGQRYSNLELIVVDNDSQDGSVDIVREEAPEARIAVNDSNEGYCRAHNQAINLSGGQYYLPLNPDVALGEDYVGTLVDTLEARMGCASAVGKLWQAGDQRPHRLDGTGLFIDRRRHQYLRGFGEPDRGQYDRAEEVFGADGAAPLYRREALEDLRILGQVYDEAFFAYMDDVDLAWRARLFGWRTWYEPKATAVHDRTFQPGSRRLVPRAVRRHAVKNRYLMLTKNIAPECWRRDRWHILSYDLRILLYVLILEQTSLAALLDYRRLRPRALSWRETIWRRVRTDDEERLGWFG